MDRYAYVSFGLPTGTIFPVIKSKLSLITAPNPPGLYYVTLNSSHVLTTYDVYNRIVAEKNVCGSGGSLSGAVQIYLPPLQLAEI